MIRAIAGVFALELLSVSAYGQTQTDNVSRARAPEPIAIAMTASQWETKENAEFLRQLGFFTV